MKKTIIVLISTIIISGFLGCEFFMGPDEPVGSGGGNLNISFGAGGNSGAERALSGAELSDAVLETLRYDITLTGPGGETIERTVSPGEKNLRLTVALGEWQIEAEAYQGDALAGSGELTWPVIPGINAIRIPMEINEGYFEITVQSGVGGEISVSPTAAFPGTIITVTAEAHDGYKLKEGSLMYSSEDYAYRGNILEGEPGIYTFEMPAADVRVYAEFNKELGFIIEVPGDLMNSVTVTGVHYPDESSSTIISWTGSEYITFTVSGNYSARDGKLKWLVNGEEKTDSINVLYSFDIKAREYNMLRTYTLTVMIQANDGLWYAGNYNFTVVE
jgi:hypothetical protein